MKSLLIVLAIIFSASVTHADKIVRDRYGNLEETRISRETLTAPLSELRSMISSSGCQPGIQIGTGHV